MRLPEQGTLLDQPETVMDDLLQWEWLVTIVENINRKKQEAERKGEHAIF
jgi:hypothetical protein